MAGRAILVIALSLVRPIGWVGMLLSAMVWTSACDRPEGRTPPPATIPARVAWTAGGSANPGSVQLESSILVAALSPAGTAAIIDPQQRAILLLDSTGRLVGKFGRQGSGPGEFERPSQLGFVNDTVLWITDEVLGRITWSTTRGRLVSTASYGWQPVPRSRWSTRGNWVLRGGTVLGATAGVATSGRHDLPPRPLVVWRPDAQALRVVGWVEQQAPTYRYIPTSRPNAPINDTQPIAGGPIIGIETSGTWFFVLDRMPSEQTDGAFTITRYSASGDSIGTIAIPYDPIVVDRDIQEWLRTYTERYIEQLPPRAGAVSLQDALEATWVPRTLPPVREVFADSAGFWIRRELFRPGLWERYDLRGRRIAATLLPPDFTGLAVSGAVILGLERDSMNVPLVKKYVIDLQSNPAKRPEASSAPVVRKVLDEGQFRRPYALITGSDSTLYASYPGELVVRAVTADGSVRIVMRGDGSVRRYPAEIGFTATGFWAVDAGSTLITFMDRNWRPLRTDSVFVPRRVGDLAGGRLLGVTAGNKLLFYASASPFALALGSPGFEKTLPTMPPQLVPSAAVRALPVWRIDIGSGIVDTLLTLSTRNQMGVLVGPESAEQPRRIVPFVQPFADYPLVAADASARHVIVIERSRRSGARPTYITRRIGADGDTTATREYAYAPVALTAEWRTAEISRRASEVGSDARAATVARTALFVPESLPPVTEVHVGVDGSVWIARENVPGSKLRTWEIVDANGRKLASAELPRDLIMRAVYGLSAWAVQRESDEKLSLWRVTVPRR